MPDRSPRGLYADVGALDAFNQRQPADRDAQGFGTGKPLRVTPEDRREGRKDRGRDAPPAP